jgi:hypothetical protein
MDDTLKFFWFPNISLSKYPIPEWLAAYSVSMKVHICMWVPTAVKSIFDIL